MLSLTLSLFIYNVGNPVPLPFQDLRRRPELVSNLRLIAIPLLMHECAVIWQNALLLRAYQLVMLICGISSIAHSEIF
jgi:hypothetical protein